MKYNNLTESVLSYLNETTHINESASPAEIKKFLNVDINPFIRKEKAFKVTGQANIVGGKVQVKIKSYYICNSLLNDYEDDKTMFYFIQKQFERGALTIKEKDIKNKTIEFNTKVTSFLEKIIDILKNTTKIHLLRSYPEIKPSVFDNIEIVIEYTKY